MIVSSNIPDYLYRNGVGMMVLNNQKKIFVGKRIKNKSNLWQMPQGGLNMGEEEYRAALRELKEETGIYKVKIIKISDKYFYYNLPYFLQKKFYGGKYLGQKQRWFLLQIRGDCETVNLKYAKPEFSQFRWVDIETLIKNVVSFKRAMYEEIINEFKEYLK
jgi:putative (di)nucleoside polyphosphate hydrolase